MHIPTPPSQWCLVGNIGRVRSPSGDSPSPGTPHYSGGTKVYCLPAQWGDGYERIVAIGRHRGSRAFSCLVTRTEHISNWRAQVVYSPAVLRFIHEWCSIKGHRNWNSRVEVEEYVHHLLVERPVANEA